MCVFVFVSLARYYLAFWQLVDRAASFALAGACLMFMYPLPLTNAAGSTAWCRGLMQRTKLPTPTVRKLPNLQQSASPLCVQTWVLQSSAICIVGCRWSVTLYCEDNRLHHCSVCSWYLPGQQQWDSVL
jgi:hypothetical protein